MANGSALLTPGGAPTWAGLLVAFLIAVSVAAIHSGPKWHSAVTKRKEFEAREKRLWADLNSKLAVRQAKAAASAAKAQAQTAKLAARAAKAAKPKPKAKPKP